MTGKSSVWLWTTDSTAAPSIQPSTNSGMNTPPAPPAASVQVVANARTTSRRTINPSERVVTRVQSIAL